MGRVYRQLNHLPYGTGGFYVVPAGGKHHRRPRFGYEKKRGDVNVANMQMYHVVFMVRYLQGSYVVLLLLSLEVAVPEIKFTH